MTTTTTPQLTNGREIAPGHPAVAPPARGGRTYTLQDVEIMARHAAASKMFGMDAAQAFTLMLIAQSEGLDPIQALRRFHVIQGRPAMRADAMLAEFQRQAGLIEWTRATDQECSAIFRHPVHAPEGVAVSFNLADARRAGLDRKEVWRAYPGPMLRARVISSGVRMVLPGVVVGIYTPEEVGDWIHEPRAAGPPPPPPRLRPRPDGRSLPPGLPDEEGDFPSPRRPSPWSTPPARPPGPAPAPAPAPPPEPEPDPDPEPEPEPIPEPDDLTAAAAAPPGAISELRRFIRREIEAAHDRLRQVLTAARVAPPDRIELANEFQVANGLVTAWIREGLLDEALVAGPGGRRDRERVGAALTDAYAGQPAEVRADVCDYLDGKVRRACAAYGLRTPGNRDEDQATADEDPPSADSGQ